MLAKIHGAAGGRTWFKVIKPKERRDEIIALDYSVMGRSKAYPMVLINSKGEITHIDLWSLEGDDQPPHKSFWTVESVGSQ